MCAQRVIVHIGYPKCGSSSIQSFFADHHTEHKRAGLCYPAAGRAREGYRSHVALFRKRTTDDELRSMFDKIEVEARNCHTILLSSEEAIGALREPARLRRCMDEAATRFGARNVTALVVVRNHFELAESSYAQFIRGGLYGVNRRSFFRRRNPTIAQYYRRIHSRDGYYPFSFSDTIDVIHGEIGECGLQVVSMHDADLGDDLVSHLADMVDVARPAERSPTVKNARFSARALLAMSYAYSHHEVDEVQARGPTIGRMFDRPEDDGRSVSLHGGKQFFEIVRACQQEDRRFFETVPGCFDAVLSSPAATPPRGTALSIELSESDRELVDALFHGSRKRSVVPDLIRAVGRELDERVSRRSR